ncbi:UDP-N-acetylmuramoylalanyl-D-glutamyl-2, 6-diaminopimelate--D-alanyl-D-alanine ligase [Aliarcobacter skirrowii]|uniref:UDP-N-acetylmuramoylalanyl-D-glutamyl-2, 6-diaminopimelate--D-alanyl-D-alanine ligase n=3 Tax=Aliarcobacter skirrowii TaxID=28200 RepID=A0A2U2BYS7_9BACT|nr:UDP-N-acetylmuramoyl-tripeptide--D-alanyl-D-alanine ligase [Aliarcobacter skirrowii]PWE19576.1 UDP-N-acetylmuramoylalanyl-D-glutamyl-2, 6-diaminopimelate--D-alanyl-D-alanine ligase [Aliarcobacter skirrowii]PWE19819.1 UDP-N-acetylmuramoylalanyl-D-glutamyl-2, 6-diaminopimelate--D-alanyl-D-alanine ligase [Aliarcobacter skirrowii]RJO55212.1 UDP-N-acetylmuramoyl-tripeptide--D-alanyl-D-alanine ligase [Aliarcobacter skirrowii]RJO57250.1 UDP-N-acetylmuramoyl-tripeptide--D-alanyl-D-alanine ligase [Al
MNYFNFFINFIAIFALSWYLILNLQWYNYKLQRVVLNHHKKVWHLFYFIFPLLLWIVLKEIYFAPILILYLIALYFWAKKLDRSLVYTKRVQRFFIILTIILIFGYFFASKIYFLFAIFLTILLSNLTEKLMFNFYKKIAKRRLNSIKDLKIVAITASYGKTSIKNFLYHILKNHFNTYKTPRSVNTIAGLVLDVNMDLPLNTQIYIAEAGARVKGDIKTIANFLEPQICVVGTIGEQHIEYFKSLENIQNTKKELLSSKRLEKAFVHKSADAKESLNIDIFPKNLEILDSSLDGIRFSFEINDKKEEFFAPILGSFNAINLSAVILVANYLKIDIKSIKESLKTLPQVEHRLQKIEANGKVIIDDSFNGNFEGMMEAFNLCKTYSGRKVIITPGLVESTIEANKKIALKIDEVFDFVILTGSLNIEVLSQNIDKDKIFILKDKSQMQNILASSTKSGDLILFANDAPNFI